MLLSDLCTLGVQDLEDLLFVGLSVGAISSGLSAFRVALRPVGSPMSLVTYKEDDMMAQILEVAHLGQEHRMAKV